MKKLLLTLSLCFFSCALLRADEAPGDYHKEVMKVVGSSVVKAGARSTPKTIKEKKYLFIYFSAHWCGPCRKFTPELVKFYNDNKETGDFDLLFVSSDTDQKSMLSYMKEAKMPWLGVRLDSRGTRELGKKYSGKGIPCLVLLDENDQVLAHSYVDGKYVGPNSVLNKYQELRKKNGK